jgi:GNAT superfamily N-acetyltransferase
MFSLLFKANPYHDRNGKFTGKGSATFVSTGGVFSRQKAHQKEQGPPGYEGRVSGSLVDKAGKKYTVFHTSRAVNVNGVEHHKHTFQVFEAAKFNHQNAASGITTGRVNSTTLHYSGKRVMDTQTEESFRRRGIASKLYDHIESKLGTKLEEHFAQSDDAKALWANRKSKTRKSEMFVELFKFNPPHDKLGRFSSKNADAFAGGKAHAHAQATGGGTE